MENFYDLPPLVDPGAGGGAGGFIPPPLGASFDTSGTTSYGQPLPDSNFNNFPSQAPWADTTGFPNAAFAGQTPYHRPQSTNFNPFPGAQSPWPDPTSQWPPPPRIPSGFNTPAIGGDLPPWARHTTENHGASSYDPSSHFPPPFAPQPSHWPAPNTDAYTPLRIRTHSAPQPADAFNSMQQLGQWGNSPTFQTPSSMAIVPANHPAQLTPFGFGGGDSSRALVAARPRSANGHHYRGASVKYIDRPSEWRRDFKVRPGFASSLLRRMSSSSSADLSEGLNPKLHHYIQYNNIRPPLTLDLRRHPTSLRFHALRRPINPWDLTRLACEPPLRHMRLYHTHLPWYIDVYAGNPTGVTLNDLFMGMYVNLMQQIRQRDLYNEEMEESDRLKVTDAYWARCQDSSEEGQGIKRIDYLRGRVLFEGLAKGRNGMWEMKTIKV